ncbi:MAG: hypothetical protein ABFS46_01470 [Myxococcota bacterium]
MFGRRPDATLVRDAAPVRRFMPFISPRRNESLVYFAQDVDVETALRFVEARNASGSEANRLTLFQVVLRALVGLFEERPRLNRFTAGGRLWQRDGIWITYSAKQRFDDDAPILTLKRRFEPGESLEEMVARLQRDLGGARSGRKTAADREMSLLLALPPFVTRALVLGVQGLDGLGLLPRSMIDPDPMHASIFVANLGSVGLEAGYHHLWEYGNVPLFCVIGRVREAEDGQRRAIFKWSFDERVEDGLYCARGLEHLQELLSHPEKL